MIGNRAASESNAAQLAVERLHRAAPAIVAPLHVRELPTRVPVDHPAPERLGTEIPRKLRDLPPPRVTIEKLACDVLPYAEASIPPEDKEIRDGRDAPLAGEMAVAVNDRESRQFPVYPDEEGMPLTISPATIEADILEPALVRHPSS
ncbi:MAG: hypothetical protein WBA63_00690 [Thermomicrobiales bacterium]